MSATPQRFSARHAEVFWRCILASRAERDELQAERDRLLLELKGLKEALRRRERANG